MQPWQRGRCGRYPAFHGWPVAVSCPFSWPQSGCPWSSRPCSTTRPVTTSIRRPRNSSVLACRSTHCSATNRPPFPIFPPVALDVSHQPKPASESCPACCTLSRSSLTWWTMHSGSDTSTRSGRPAQPRPRPERRAPWPARRLFPILGTVGLIVFGMAGTIWGPRYYGKSAWSLPDDLWATMVAAQRLLHLDLGGLYTSPTNLVSFPGAAVILVPVVALMDAAGLTLRAGAQAPRPGEWLLIGPYAVAISAVAPFASDALAERLGFSLPKRFLLAAASATALWNVTLRWGHPEDAVATGLLLYGILELSRSRTAPSWWFIGAAVAVQPLVLLAVPLLVAVLEPRRPVGFLARAAPPSVVPL